jgi:flavodoxin I
MSIAIIFGSLTGNTETAAHMIKDELGDHVTYFADVADINPKDLLPYDVLLLGCPTWHIGQLQDDWEDFLPQMSDLDLSGKKVGFFGMGDSYGYSENFLDAFGLMWDELKKLGSPDLIGIWSTEGYTFNESIGMYDENHFLGLGLDEDNEEELHGERVTKWTQQILKELGLS